MAHQLFRPLHLPRRPMALQRPLRLTALGEVQPPPGRHVGASVFSTVAPLSRPSWRSQALREGLLATLITTFLTSAVVACPEVFRQSPTTTLRQFTIGAIVTGPSRSPWQILDCL